MELAVTDDNLSLLLIFFGLYLADCVVVLRPAQALALPHLRRRRANRGIGAARAMSLAFGLTGYPIRGRYLALLNPLTPFVAAFKTLPIDAQSAPPGALSLRQMTALRIRTARMSLALTAHGVLMFVVLPLLLLSGETERLLIALGAAFLSAILILGVAYADRRAARLPNSGFWAVAGQALLCLPASLNAPRKLALLAPVAVRAPELLADVPETERPAALTELRLTLDHAAGEKSRSLAEAAEALQRKLSVDYPEA